MNNNVNTLLILGNGFDLHCELTTSYSKFINYIDKDSSTVCKYSSDGDNRNCIIGYLYGFKKFVHQMRDYELKYNGSSDGDEKKSPSICPLFRLLFNPMNIGNYNFWQSYLNLLYNIKNITRDVNYGFKFNDPIYLNNWCDIESQIEYFFHQYSECLDKFIYYYKQYYQHNPLKNPQQRQKVRDKIILSFQNDMYQEFKSDNRNHTNRTNTFMIPLIIVVLRRCYHLKTDNLYSFLFNELYDFENKFKSFLQHTNHDDYSLDLTGKSKNTKFTQLKNDTTKELTNDQPYNLITFNYTNDKTEKCHNSVNVHSNIFTGHPIFGIDATNNFDKEYYKFTKTYRIMKLANKTNNHILDLSKNKEMKNIVFYGQSLAPADYMYFKAIFNHYHIYSNTMIQLTFFYSSVINGKKTESEEKHQFSRIYKLMNKYGMEIHHSDLLHKMLLEGRLCIRDLDEDK